MALNPKLLETVQLALGSHRPVLRLVPRHLKGLYLGLERPRGADLNLVRVKAPVAFSAQLVAHGALVTIGFCHLLPEVLLQAAHGALCGHLPLAIRVLSPLVGREQLLSAQAIVSVLAADDRGNPDVSVRGALVQMNLGG